MAVGPRPEALEKEWDQWGQGSAKSASPLFLKSVLLFYFLGFFLL